MCPNPPLPDFRSEKIELARGGIGQAGGADADEAEGAGNEFIAREEPAAQAINLGRLGDGVLHGNLAREGGEVFIADFYLDGASGEFFALEAAGDFGGLFL